MTDSQFVRFGKYLLLHKIATGGMAQLYMAKIMGIQGFEKLIAFKMLLPHYLQDKELVDSFINEAKLAALLHHQNIVQIYDFGSSEDSYFISMEYLFGKDMKAIWNKAQGKDHPVSLENALNIVSRVCAGLVYAHELKDFQGKPLNIIHRDISPPNIFVTYQGEVKILDFGIAKAASQSTATQFGMIKGKVAYMSPEQAAGKPIDQRSDIFSLGILLYELVTQSRMFTGDNTIHILTKVREGEFNPPQAIAREVPQKILTILNRTIAKEPEQRYQTCAEMLADLEECMIEFSIRPGARGLASYIKELFAEEIIQEDELIRKLNGAGGAVRDNTEITINIHPTRTEKTENTISFLHIDPPVTVPENQITKNTPKEPVKQPSGKTAGASPGATIEQPTATKPQPQQDSVTSGKKEKPIVEFTPRPIKAKRRRHFLYLSIVFLTALTCGGVYLFVQNKINIIGLVNDKQQIASNNQPSQPPAVHDTSVSEPSKTAKDTEQKVYPATVTATQFQQQEKPAEDSKAKAQESQNQAKELARKNPEKAKKLLLEVVRLDPKNEEAQLFLATVCMKLKDYSGAIKAYEEILDTNYDTPTVAFNLGFAYAMNKNLTKAEEMYNRVVKLAPPYLDEAFFNLAMVQEKQGKKDMALENLKNALSVNPNKQVIKTNYNRLSKNMEKSK